MNRMSAILGLLVACCCWQPVWAYSEDPGSGTLLLRFGQQPVRWVAPTLDTDVTINVNGPVARAVVKQRFYNPSDKWAEASYLFPLPEDAAVDRMRLRVGERVIEGQIKERQQAKKIYREAKRSGKRASLVEQQRPNLFTTSVANIPPGEQVVVEIEYQHEVSRDGNRYSLRYPMAITPRYTPGQVVPDSNHGEPQKNSSSSEPPWPVTVAGNNLAGNPTRIEIKLNPGFELGQVISGSHSLQTTERQPVARNLLVNETAADRDFLLDWYSQAAEAPQVAFFVQQYQGDQYGLLQITPPELEAGAV
ncbi:MAG: VIT domain-containing protein, partial [Porticoccaceae bacterium]|nr:VIT domain-containing protein [Porticoccaceae bacterium]